MHDIWETLIAKGRRMGEVLEVRWESLLPADRARRISIDTALQAATLARARDVERACVVARQAIDHATGMTSFRAAHRIVLMLAELHTHADAPDVRDVVDYAHTQLPRLIPSSG